MPEPPPVADRATPPWWTRRAALVMPVVVSLFVQVPASVWGLARLHPQIGWPAVVHVLLAVAAPLTLLAARRAPGAVVVAVTAMAVADVFLTPVYGPPFVSLGFAIIGAVVRGAAVWAAASVVVGWATVLLVASFGAREWPPPVVVLATIALAACFAVGGFARARRARMEALREEAARERQTAEQRERVRIARELHDVLGHSLSQISVQAGVGLHLFDRDPEQARAALAHVKETSKQALDEVRAVLGVLREGETPLTPGFGLAELPRLVHGAAGGAVQTGLDDRLGGDLPDRATQLAAYRIVQEALTNVVRHSGASRARVTLERSHDALRIGVVDDGRGTTESEVAASGGRGVLGMQERAALLGGRVDVRRRTEGGTEVAATLPWRADGHRDEA